jgi:hypothetical protein
MFLSKKKGDSAESRGGMVKSRRIVFFVDTRAASPYTPPTKKRLRKKAAGKARES